MLKHWKLEMRNTFVLLNLSGIAFCLRYSLQQENVIGSGWIISRMLLVIVKNSARYFYKREKMMYYIQAGVCHLLLR